MSSALLCHRIPGHTLLYPTRLLGSMHCFCMHFGIPYQVVGFHALLLGAHCSSTPGCWVPCTAAVGTWSYRARLLGSMHGCYVYSVIQCQVAGFHALLLGEHCRTRCWVLCNAAVRYCRSLSAIVMFCMVFACAVLSHVVADIVLAGLYPLCPVLVCQVHGGLYFCVLCCAMSPDAGVL